MKAAALVLLLALGGCAGDGSRPAHPMPPNWRSIATEEDRDRISNWRTAWIEALGKANASGSDAEIAKEGSLLQPDAALPFQPPPPGDYACRTIKIGARSEGLLDYIAYPPFICRIEPDGDILRFRKLSGSQRPIGRLFSASRDRMIFLGTLQLGDERGVHAYGDDRERDMAGFLERIGDARWRLVLPYPHFESTLDLVEIVPQS